MNKRSFVDLTALLDVMLILFFAAIINIAGNAEQIKEETKVVQDEMTLREAQIDALIDELTTTQNSLQSALTELDAAKGKLNELYGTEAEDIEDYQVILSRISMIDVHLVSELNQVWINSSNTNINIIKERLETTQREQILIKELKNALDLALEQRTKSSIIFLKLSVKDRDVYKYAFDFLLDVVEHYGKDKVIISRDYY